MFCDECNQESCICAEIQIARMKDITEKQRLFLDEVRLGLHPDFFVNSQGQLEFIGEMPHYQGKE